MRHTFDENGSVIGFSTHYPNFADGYWENYLFAKSLQGDVVAVYRSDYNSTTQTYYPTLVASYEYAPWGKVTKVKGSAGTVLSLEAYPNHIAHVNPIRYRGYYYDNETGFYYLQSRYYDPAISRFINADSYATTGQGFLGTNMFAYCLNNPIIYVDSEGHMAETAILVTNYWNPLGWAAAAVLAIECVALAIEVVDFTYDVYSVSITAENDDAKVETDVLTSVASAAVGGAVQPPNNNDDNKISFKKVSNYLLKKCGLDAHKIKREYLGRQAQISHYDLSYDTKTGIVYILTKAGEIVAKTYYNVFIDRPPLR